MSGDVRFYHAADAFALKGTKVFSKGTKIGPAEKVRTTDCRSTAKAAQVMQGRHQIF